MPKLSDIKRAQKASLLLKSISQLYYEASRDNKELLGLSITRVELSPNKSMCYVYFYIPEGKEIFNQKLPTLKLYKPSLRHALSKSISNRYTPEIIFKFDNQQAHIDRIDILLERVKDDLHDNEQHTE
jgi:ribosome-binding factor A